MSILPPLPTPPPDPEPEATDQLEPDGGDQEPEAEPLADLLDELHGHLTDYVQFPVPEAADAVCLYIAATHAQDAWQHASRLAITSPHKRCGKTRLMEVCRETVHKALPTTNISPAALARSINEADPPTLLLDEADTVFSKKKSSDSAEDLRGILNSGYGRGWPYTRWDPMKRQPERCPTFAMAILGGIGHLPDTIEDRAVVIRMARRRPGDSVKQWRSKRAIPPLRKLRDRLQASVRATAGLSDAEPANIGEDRVADTWEPLAAIADAAGRDWSDRVRKACQELAGVADDDADSAGERLLADLLAMFTVTADGTTTYRDDIETTAILTELHAMEEAPWGDWYGRPFSARDLAKLLRPYGVKSHNVVRGTTRPKGYRLIDLVDPWTRYLTRPGRGTATTATSATSDETAGQSGGGGSGSIRYLSATSAPGAATSSAVEPQRSASSGKVADGSETSATASDQHKHPQVADVADVAQERLSRATPPDGTDDDPPPTTTDGYEVI